SIFTTRTSTAIPTPSRCSSAVSARNSASTSFRRSAVSVICSRRPMRANSLALRLFLWATGCTVVILIITGIALSTLYRHAVERAFDRRLDVYLRTLVADVASPEEGSDRFPQSIGEPLFELPLSGWYWQVTRLDAPKPDVHSSRSLWDAKLPRLRDDDTAGTGYFQGYAQGPEDVRLRIAERH